MIMHFITNFTANAGAERMLARLVNESRSSECMIVSMMEISDNIRVSVNQANVEFVALKATSMFDMPRAVIKLARLINEHRPKAVMCWMYHAMVVGSVAARLSRHKVNLIWNVRQSLDDVSSLSRSTRTAVRTARWLSRWPKAIIFNSLKAMKTHRDFGYRNRSMSVVPNGFQMPPELANEARLPRIFGIAARFHPQKDYGNFFSAAAIVKRAYPFAKFRATGAHVTLANPDLQKLLATAGLDPSHVELCGESSDMTAFYNSVDAIVLSSRTEGFPNVVAEAMSHGRPVITTDVGDAKSIVADTGYCVPPGDPKALAKAMIALLDWTQDEYRTRSIAARRRISENYSLASVAAKYSELLES